jgi:hypothetical protein
MAPQDTFIEEEEDTWSVSPTFSLPFSSTPLLPDRVVFEQLLTILLVHYVSKNSTFPIAIFGHVLVDTR